MGTEMTKDYTENCTKMSYLATQDRDWLMSVTEHIDCSTLCSAHCQRALPDFPRFR